MPSYPACMRAPHVVGVGGTTRSDSSTERALRHVLRLCEKEGATSAVFTGAELDMLPHYTPENPIRTPHSQRLVDEYRRADAIVVASPGYHGGLSGLVKNALDYAEDLRDDARVYFSGLPVGCVVTGAGWQAAVTTLQALRAIVHALRGWPTPMGAAINVALDPFGPDGSLVDERVGFQLTMVAREVMTFTRWRLAADARKT
jgi:FMN reductase